MCGIMVCEHFRVSHLWGVHAWRHARVYCEHMVCPVVCVMDSYVCLMFVNIDYRVLFAHGLVRFVDSWSLGGELTRMHWYIDRTCLLTYFATGFCHANMTLGIVVV